MIDDLIRPEDVRWASELMGLGPYGFAPIGGDDSRLRAMLRMDTVDFEACPGSGKTTLLVAKLAILAKRWPYRDRGICVLSHTNAARNEIDTRLGRSAAGLALTRYPHFVGTIHSFVNEFLALPWIRSKGFSARHIDNEITLRKRWNALRHGTRKYLEKKRRDYNALSYSRSDFSCKITDLIAPERDTHRDIINVRRATSAEGYFCFDELFVWAREFIEMCPSRILDIRKRFPLIFIDEAQDNSEEQSEMLYRIFSDGADPVRRQRFGDSNQAIYSSIQAEGANTDKFPGPIVHDILRSYRFGQIQAEIANGFGVKPHGLIGAGPPKLLTCEPMPPVVFLFDDASVQLVLPRYGAHLVNVFDEAVLKDGVFTAVAGVHKLENEKNLPHAMGHYVPGYDPGLTRKETTPLTFGQYLARAQLASPERGNSDKLVNATASALLVASQLSGAKYSLFSRKSPHRRMIDMFKDGKQRARYLDLVDLVVQRRGHFDAETWDTLVRPQAEAILRELSHPGALHQRSLDFLASCEAHPAQGEAAFAAARNNLFAYPDRKPKVRIRLSSIHSVKGETHTATLVLDTFYRKHHLFELKPWLLGNRSGGSKAQGRRMVSEGPEMLKRLRLHYVAMTRPTHLLCLAMRHDHLTDEERDILEGRGWQIKDCRDV